MRLSELILGSSARLLMTITNTNHVADSSIRQDEMHWFKRKQMLIL